MILKGCNLNYFIFLLILFIRLSAVFVVQTFFVPDEYWQSLEIAHRMAYGYGHLTWEWEKKIRSCLYPLTFYILYSIFPESTGTVILLPKIFQVILSSIGDFLTYKLSCKLFGWKCAQWTLFNLLTSWFLYYCAARTLTNTTEMSLAACGLYFYPWHKGKRKWLTCNYLWLAGLSTAIRPTAIVFWIPLYLYHLWREKDYIYIIKHSVFIGCVILAFLVACDWWFYGQLTFTPYNFFIFNWSNDIGAFYGQHNFLWYFFVGLPVVLGIHCIPFIMGITMEQLKPFYLLILWTMFIFSIPSHKEFRFLLPILPIALVSCSVTMSEISSGRMTVVGWKINRKFNILLIFVVLFINIPLSIYMGMYHQRGIAEATLHLSQIVNKDSSVLFLMPCHSTPYYSHIHQNISMRFLSCEPNFNNTSNYTDEADIFYEEPMLWLSQNYDFSNRILIPSHLVMYDSLQDKISPFLYKHRYNICYKTFNSHFPESRTGKFVHIYCR